MKLFRVTLITNDRMTSQFVNNQSNDSGRYDPEVLSSVTNCLMLDGYRLECPNMEDALLDVTMLI